MPKSPPKAPKPPRVPSYCHHKAVGQAYVRIRGKLIYLGKYGSEASRAAYAAVVADILAGREVASRRPRRGEAIGPAPATVREVAKAFNRFAESYYVKSGRATAEVALVAGALGYAVALFGDQPAAAFGPVALKAVRERMVAHGLARSTVNGAVSRIRRAFKWAAADELIPATRYWLGSCFVPLGRRVRGEHMIGSLAVGFGWGSCGGGSMQIIGISIRGLSAEPRRAQQPASDVLPPMRRHCRLPPSPLPATVVWISPSSQRFKSGYDGSHCNPGSARRTKKLSD